MVAPTAFSPFSPKEAIGTDEAAKLAGISHNCTHAGRKGEIDVRFTPESGHKPT